jgi:basic membrane protein A
LIADGVFDLIQKANQGNFPSGNYVGEVDLAPFHDFEGRIPSRVKEALSKIQDALRSGALSTGA